LPNYTTLDHEDAKNSRLSILFNTFTKQYLHQLECDKIR